MNLTTLASKPVRSMCNNMFNSMAHGLSGLSPLSARPCKTAASLAVIALLALGAAGCKAKGEGLSTLDDGAIVLEGKKPKGSLPAYDELAKKYNQRVAAIPQFTSQAQIEIFYHDEDGKRHYEQADQGRVILLLPDHMAVLVRKFGVGDLFLAGSDDKQYWLFDLTNKDRRVLYEGSRAAAQSGGSRMLPVPVQPRDLPTLMGLAPLPVGDAKSSVTAVQGGYLLTPADSHWRVVVDAKTTLPLRVDLLRMEVVDQDMTLQKRVYMTSLLTMPRKLETEGIAVGNRPWLMKRIELRPHDSGDYLVVHLSAMANDGDVAAEDRAFNLERLKRTYKPDEVVDLDKR